MSDKIRVLIVDDSTLMREALRSLLESEPLIEIIGMAKDGKEGVEKALQLRPDVITMDIKMPIMSGLEAIEKIMEEAPVPIIVVSSIDVEVIVRALGIGAMDFVAVTQDADAISKDLIEKIKISSRVRPLKRIKIKPVIACKSVKRSDNLKVIAIGVSTGGPQALHEVISNLPCGFPASIIIVQHMSKGFIQGLADWLNANCSLDIKVAKAGDILKGASVFLAPDNYNLKVDKNGRIILSEDTSKAMLHVPSIDVMMKSVADSYGKDAVGLIMTGMGQDGVLGIKAIRDSEGITIAQDEKTSVIFGMNKLAIEAGCIDMVIALDRIAEELANIVGCIKSK